MSALSQVTGPKGAGAMRILEQTLAKRQLNARHELCRSCLPGYQCDIGWARERQHRRIVVGILLDNCLWYVPNSLSVEEKVDPRVDEAERPQLGGIFLSLDLRNPECMRLHTEDAFPPTLRNRYNRPSLKERHGGFTRRPTKNGTENPFSRSYKSAAMVKLSERNPAIAVPISASGMARGMCDVGRWLDTVILAGRQLLRYRIFPSTQRCSHLLNS